LTQHKRFYPELESLRGVAAVLVLGLHVILATMVLGLEHPAPGMVERLGLPSALFAGISLMIFNGRSAVIMFFVLSGFVMSVGFDTAKALDLRTYAAFLIKRLFRLMPAIWAAVLFAVALGYFGRGQPFNLTQIVSFLLLTDLSADPVLWSLVVELAMCLIYPLMLVATRQIGTGPQVIVLCGLLWFTRWYPDAAVVHYGITFYTLPLLPFYLGLVVPTVGRALIELLSGFSVALVPVAVLFFIAPELISYYNDFHPGAITPWAIGFVLPLLVPLGCFYIIAWLIYSPTCATRDLLLRPEFLFLGRTSYSIYLFHAPLAAWAMGYTAGIASPILRLVLGIIMIVPATLAISALCYRYIERPFTRWGRALADAIASRRLSETVIRPVVESIAARHAQRAGANPPARELKGDTAAPSLLLPIK
jgi:peptidoglycan/LPS O-acetylase OafA/YrhL